MSNHLTDEVYDRGQPPQAFVDELWTWGRMADESIFEPNHLYDIYSSVFPQFGPYVCIDYRIGVMLEVMRVLAGFESSWDWNCGIDTTNPSSNTPTTAEAGAWQVSADSMNFGDDLKELVYEVNGTLDPIKFQQAMKEDHLLAMEYVARLLRYTTKHHGPVARKEINPELNPLALLDFLKALA